MKMVKFGWLGLMALAALFLTGPTAAGAGAPVKVDILYMNHGPMQPVLKNLKDILTRHAGQVTVAWHDFEQDSGREFMANHDIHGHIPLLIYINGSPSARLGDRSVTFGGFPNGFGPYQFQGKWDMNDFDQVLSSLAGRP